MKWKTIFQQLTQASSKKHFSRITENSLSPHIREASKSSQKVQVVQKLTSDSENVDSKENPVQMNKPDDLTSLAHEELIELPEGIEETQETQNNLSENEEKSENSNKSEDSDSWIIRILPQIYKNSNFIIYKMIKGEYNIIILWIWVSWVIKNNIYVEDVKQYSYGKCDK